MPTAYSLGMLGFFVVGVLAGGYCGYRIGHARGALHGTEKLRERVDKTLGLLQRRMTTLEDAVSVTAEAERLLRQYNEDNGSARD